MKLFAGSAGQKTNLQQKNGKQTNLIEQTQGLQLHIRLPQLLVHCCHVVQGRKALEVHLEGPLQVLKSCLRLALGRWEEMEVSRTSC